MSSPETVPYAVVLDTSPNEPYLSTTKRIALGVVLAIILVIMFLFTRESLLSQYGLSRKATALYTGTGAAFKAAVLPISQLQTSYNPYFNAFKGAFTAGTDLDKAFPRSGAPTKFVVQSKSNDKVIVVSKDIAATAFNMIKARRDADELTPANAQADLATLVANSDNINSAIKAVTAAYGKSFTLSNTLVVPAYCCSPGASCPVGYTVCKV
jgi:hypothetical protein